MLKYNEQTAPTEIECLDDEELDAVRGGEKTTCTVDKVTTFLGFTFAHATCDNGMGITFIQPPGK